MVKLRQDAYLESNHVGSKKDYSVPSFKNIGEAYGIKSHAANKIEDIYEIIEKSLANNEPELIDIQISGEMTTVEPRLDFNRSFEDMRPYLERDELQKQMFM
jgi:acetolactate synthase-1/2/3 large subunit